MIMQEPIEITLKLMSNEILIILDALDRVPRDIFEAFNYDKLRKALETQKRGKAK